MTPTAPVTDLRAQRIWRGDDGIVRVWQREGVILDRADAEAGMDVCERLAGTDRCGILVDTRASRGLDREARAIFAGPRPPLHFSAIALLVGSPLSRVTGNFFLAISRPLIAFRMFDDEVEAVAWLLNQPARIEGRSA